MQIRLCRLDQIMQIRSGDHMFSMFALINVHSRWHLAPSEAGLMGSISIPWRTNSRIQESRKNYYYDSAIKKDMKTCEF